MRKYISKSSRASQVKVDSVEHSAVEPESTVPEQSVEATPVDAPKTASSTDIRPVDKNTAKKTIKKRQKKPAISTDDKSLNDALKKLIEKYKVS